MNGSLKGFGGCSCWRGGGLGTLLSLGPTRLVGAASMAMKRLGSLLTVVALMERTRLVNPYRSHGGGERNSEVGVVLLRATTNG